VKLPAQARPETLSEKNVCAHVDIRSWYTSSVDGVTAWLHACRLYTDVSYQFLWRTDQGVSWRSQSIMEESPSEPNSRSADQDIPHVLWNQKVHHRVNIHERTGKLKVKWAYLNRQLKAIKTKWIDQVARSIIHNNSLSQCLYIPFGPWMLFQFLNSIHSRQDSLDGGSARRKAAIYTQNNASTDIHVRRWIRTHDPSVRACEDRSCLRPRGRPLW
jgi:hypothetical protein